MPRVPTAKEKAVALWLLRFGIEGQLAPEPEGFVSLSGYADDVRGGQEADPGQAGH